MSATTSTPVTGPGAAPLLDIRDLYVTFRQRRRPPVHAVRGASLTVGRGEIVGVLGESGSGKSTIGNAVLGLVTPTAGTVTFDGEALPAADRDDRQRLARRIQVVFQDAFGSMNPARTVGDTLGEALRFNLRLSDADVAARLARALERVGLDATALGRHPAQFSGGQLQRLAIARALVVEPDLVICDEAVSALDLSVQAQVVNLLVRLRRELGLAYLFISHDTAVVRHLSDRIVVLYAGRIVEDGPAELVADAPRHPYTQALVLAAPVPDLAVQTERRRLRRSGADTTAPIADDGCAYRLRCAHATDVCATEVPPLVVQSTGGRVACHHSDRIQPVRVAAGSSRHARRADDPRSGEELHEPPT